jgi:dephospho-CoA kinase
MVPTTLKSQPKSTPFQVVGLTGSVGSGKSQVAEILRELGADIIDADLLAREVTRPGSDVLNKIAAGFGQQFLTSSGELRRKELAKVVFNDQARRIELENIVHPSVRQLFRQRLQDLQAAQDQSSSLIVYVVPLLFETRFPYNEIDKIIVISAPREMCINRIINRDGYSRDLAEKIYSSQLPIREKEQSADIIIENSKDLETLKLLVKNAYDCLVS